MSKGLTTTPFLIQSWDDLVPEPEPEPRGPSILLDATSRDILGHYLQFRRRPAGIEPKWWQAYAEGTKACIPFPHLGAIVDSFGSEILHKLGWPVTETRPTRDLFTRHSDG